MSQVPTMDQPRHKSPPRWIPYVRLARGSSLPLVWTNALAGISLAGGQFDASLAWLFVALSLIQVASMYLNHAFDQRLNWEPQPDRLVSRNEIAPSRLLMRAYFILAGGVFLIMMKTDYVFQPMILAILLGCAVVYYNRQHRRGRFATIIGATSPVLMYFVSAATIGDVFVSEVIIGATVQPVCRDGTGWMGDLLTFVPY